MKSEKNLHAVVNEQDFLRVLSNLLNNASEATSINVAIRITVSTVKDLIYISVSDSGPGIPQDLLAQIIDGHLVSTKSDGLGLGLSHAITTVESWGGRVQIDFVPGIGTTVTLVLRAG